MARDARDNGHGPHGAMRTKRPNGEMDNPEHKRPGKKKPGAASAPRRSFGVPPDSPALKGDPAGGEARPRPSGLTKNERLLWDVLAVHDGPLKAYEILDLLKEKGVRAPMTVYRALDGLETKGVVHKLDAMKAYVRCNHDAPHEVQAFLVCEICQTVKEIEFDAVATGIAPAVRRAGFDMHTARLEVRGVCDNCYCAQHDHKPARSAAESH